MHLCRRRNRKFPREPEHLRRNTRNDNSSPLDKVAIPAIDPVFKFDGVATSRTQSVDDDFSFVNRYRHRFAARNDFLKQRCGIKSDPQRFVRRTVFELQSRPVEIESIAISRHQRAKLY